MGDQVNIIFDDIQALLNRIFMLPLAFQITLYIIINLVLWLTSFKILGMIAKPMEKNIKSLIFISSCILSISIGIAAAWDHKNHVQQTNIMQNALLKNISNDEIKNTNDTIKHLNISASVGSLGIVKSQEIFNKDGIEIVQLQSEKRKAIAYVACFSLNDYEPVLDTAISVKELISTYAKRFDLDIAVNGEAGTTPGKTAPLGPWTGSYVVNGAVIKNEDTDTRPFVYFDRSGNIYYSPENDIVKTFDDKMFNVIWGRFDLLRDGNLAISPKDGTQRNPYPRTVVGMDSTGKYVYLMVVDGRNPDHSMGMTMEECGKILLEVGCHNAMACDQGGSSAMYLKNYGIITRPADGSERVVYTHLGFKRR
jgi:hypothetical protein